MIRRCLCGNGRHFFSQCRTEGGLVLNFCREPAHANIWLHAATSEAFAFAGRSPGFHHYCITLATIHAAEVNAYLEALHRAPLPRTSDPRQVGKQTSDKNSKHRASTTDPNPGSSSSPGLQPKRHRPRRPAAYQRPSNHSAAPRNSRILDSCVIRFTGFACALLEGKAEDDVLASKAMDVILFKTGCVAILCRNPHSVGVLHEHDDFKVCA